MEQKPSALGSAMSRMMPTTPGPAASAFQAALAGSRICAPYDLKLPNGQSFPCVMTLIGVDLLLTIEGVTRRVLADRGIPVEVLTEGNFELARAIQILAHALRVNDPAQGASAPAIGDASDIGRLSLEEIQRAYREYNELREKHDPLGYEVELTQVEVLELKAAIEKKNATTLRLFGLSKLIAYTLITGAPSSP